MTWISFIISQTSGPTGLIMHKGLWPLLFSCFEDTLLITIFLFRDEHSSFVSFLLKYFDFLFLIITLTLCVVPQNDLISPFPFLLFFVNLVVAPLFFFLTPECCSNDNQSCSNCFLFYFII